MTCTTTSADKKTRILIVDDHPIVREGLAMFLNMQPNLMACCQATTADEALAAMQSCEHCLVIADLSLSDDSGLNLIKQLRTSYPDIRILALSMHEETLFAERALRSGADGYLMKQEGTKNILQAVNQLLAGNVYLSQAMQNILNQRLLSPQVSKSGNVGLLTEREFEVLHLIGLGFGTRQIAEKLGRSIKTIDAHRAGIKEKLKLKSGRDLDRFAVQLLEAG
jgi:DNA-binding NarL/FixJ family response regulator